MSDVKMTLENYEGLHKTIDNLRKENKRLREALEELPRIVHPRSDIRCKVILEIAKQALGEV